MTNENPSRRRPRPTFAASREPKVIRRAENLMIQLTPEEGERIYARRKLAEAKKASVAPNDAAPEDDDDNR